MLVFKSRLGFVWSGLLCAFVAGCAEPPEMASNPLDCFPEAARSFIPIVSAEAPNRIVRRPGPVTVQIDGSQSMQGYLRGATQQARPLADIIGTSPWRRLEDISASFVLFGDEFTPIEGDAQAALGEEATYTALTSHIDDALERIAQDRRDNSVNILITDLWLSNPQNSESDSAALGEPLRRILGTGRGISVYGIRAPYSGPIYDFPDGRRGITASLRPLYVIVVGQADALESFDHNIRNSTSAFLRAGFTDGNIQRSIFDLGPGRPLRSASSPFTGNLAQAGLVEGPVLEMRDGLELAQFTFDASNVIDRGAPLIWREPPPAPGLVRAPSEQFSVQAWELVGRDRCVAEDWTPWGDLQGGWSTDRRTGLARYSFEPTELTRQLPSGTYLVVGRVIRTAMPSNPPANAWMRDPAWSLSPDAASLAAAVARQDRLMPTLGLSEAAWVLEHSLDEAVATATPSPSSAGFAFIIKVED